MSNPLKGEVPFEANGKPYVFKFGTNAQCIIEDRTGKTMSEYLRGMGDDKIFGVKDLRLIFFAGLSARQPDITESKCGDIIDTLGADQCVEIFTKAVGLAAPKGNGEDPTMPGPKAGQIGMPS